MVGVDLGVNDVPIVGEPIAFGTGFIALLLVLLSSVLGVYPITLAHEGGHMLANLATLRGNEKWVLNDDATAVTTAREVGIWLARLISGFVGYATPSLLGLAGAALIAAGNPWAVLLASAFLSVLAVALSRNGLAFLVPALITLGIGWLLLAGSSALQAAIAVGIAWFLLLGGFVDTLRLLKDPSSDGGKLAEMTLIPNFLWTLTWVFVGLVSLIIGGQLLLRPGYELG
jgi:Peptidase M50B-like